MPSIDWADETPRTLDAICRIAFPLGGVTPATLKRRVRQGKPGVTRPGKQYMTTLADVAKMIEACRVTPAARVRPASAAVPNSLGLTEADLARLALDAAFKKLRARDRKKR